MNDLDDAQIEPLLSKIFWTLVPHNVQLYGYFELSHLHKIFQERNLFYYVAFGTLLGIVRDRTFIADNDLDIGVKIKDFDEIRKVLEENAYLLICEYHIDTKKKGAKFISPSSCCIDLYFLHEEGSDIFGISFMTISGEWFNKEEDYFYLKYDENYLKEGLMEYCLSDKVRFNIPKNYEQHLLNYYGENYKIPDPDFYSSQRFLDAPGIIEYKREKFHHSLTEYQNYTTLTSKVLFSPIDYEKIKYGFYNPENILKSHFSLEQVYKDKIEFVQRPFQTLEKRLDVLLKHTEQMYNKMLFPFIKRVLIKLKIIK